MTTPPPMADRTAELLARRAEVKLGGGAERLDKQHAQGKMTARERIDALMDKGTFLETGMFALHQSSYFGLAEADLPADGVVTGEGAVFGRPVHVASQDFTVAGGSAGEVHSDKVAAMMKSSLMTGTPFVFINDSGGARVQEGIGSLAGYGRVFFNNVLLSGVVPQISIIAGPCAGGAAYSPALTDFVIQTRQATMFITGPNVIQQVTGEQVSSDELGGADTHMTRSGVNHFVVDDDQQAIVVAQKLLSFLPQNNTEDPPVVNPNYVIEPDESMADVVPVDGKKGYDIREVIGRIVDWGDFLEVQSGYAPNIVVGFGRITGRTVGIVANQPLALSGVLDINASDKGSAFIRFCNAFNIPLLTLVDVPGFLPGVAQEHNGIIRHGAKMLYAYSAASVPKVTTAPRSRRRTSRRPGASSTTSSARNAPARWCPVPWRCWSPSATCDLPRSMAWGPHERPHIGRRPGRCAGPRGAGRCAGGRARRGARRHAAEGGPRGRRARDLRRSGRVPGAPRPPHTCALPHRGGCLDPAGPGSRSGP